MQSGSCEYSKSELDMQNVPPNLTTIQESQFIDYHSIALLDSYHAPIEFVVPGHTEYYTDLSQTCLCLKFRILRANGTNLEADKNNFFYSVFSGIDLYHGKISL